jgi:hypothetical protein
MAYADDMAVIGWSLQAVSAVIQQMEEPALTIGWDINVDKKFWQELICLLSLHKLTVNILVTMEHKQSKFTAEQGSRNNVEHQ